MDSHPGRQSPPPELQKGPQLSDLPGWSGKAERENGGARPMRNPSASHHLPGFEHIEQQPGHEEKEESMEEDMGVTRLMSNPVHPLAEAARKKAEKSELRRESV